jgi:NAD(P)-dependent dehydrogenase (short-subunit alcohol dehydrogenase family)
MSRIFITGSADGLGSLAAQKCLAEGHEVVLHARNAKRAEAARNQAPGAETLLVADLSRVDEIKQLAAQVNALGHFDAVIHNAGIYSAPPHQLFTVNSLAPYILTCLIHRPERLIYTSSGSHLRGTAALDDLASSTTYSDSKFQLMLLMKAVSRAWPQVFVNAVDPGWVPTKMGGAGAPDDLTEGYATQVWLATSDDPEAKMTGRYLYHRRPAPDASGTSDRHQQDAFMAECEQLTNIRLPS